MPFIRRVETRRFYRRPALQDFMRDKAKVVP
jgi:hypothetical protein